MIKRKTKFSVNQPVVIRYGSRKLIGTVSAIKPVGKQYVYNVIGEDGKEYDELTVDSTVNSCIDTYLTKLFYKKYNISIDNIPTKEILKVSGIYLPESVNTEPVEEDTPEINIRDYSVDYDEENPDQY